MRQRIEFKQIENVLKDLDRYNCSSTLINVYIQFLIQTRTKTKLFLVPEIYFYIDVHLFLIPLLKHVEHSLSSNQIFQTDNQLLTAEDFLEKISYFYLNRLIF